MSSTECLGLLTPTEDTRCSLLRNYREHFNERPCITFHCGYTSTSYGVPMTINTKLDIQSAPEHLLALQTGVTSYGLAVLDIEDSPIFGVWLWTNAGLLVVTPASILAGGEIQVCTLAMCSPETLLAQMRADDQVTIRELVNRYLPIATENLPEAFSPPLHIQPWPFADWEVKVLKRMEWIEPAMTMSLDRPIIGEAPPNARTSCLTAEGLLFIARGANKRLLIRAAHPPFITLEVTEDPAAIDGHIEWCLQVPVQDYVSDHFTGRSLCW